jgi:hypothetical protein
LYDGDKINSCGLICHFSGLSFTRGLGKDSKEYPKNEYVSGFHGCCFAMKKSDYISLGGFDEIFFMYEEDAEFSWRANIYGFKVLYVSNSIIYHDYALRINSKKIFFLEKGRYIILKKYLSKKNLLLLFPSLFLAEILTLFYSILQGKNGLRSKLSAIRFALEYKPEASFSLSFDSLYFLDLYIPTDQVSYFIFDRYFRSFCNKIFSINWRLVN